MEHCTWFLPCFSLAVAVSTDAYVLLAIFTLLGLVTWRGAWRMWGAGGMVTGTTIASATLAVWGRVLGRVN